MKIAIVGCGALGSYYGAKLCLVNHDVHFLLRSDYEIVRRHGVHIQSPDGNFHVQPRCAQRPEEIGPADLILIGLKTTANSQFPKLLPPLIGPHTAVMTLQNGLGNEDQLARFIPPEKILGGLCFVCLNRVAPGKIHHLGQGTIVMGEYHGLPQPRTHLIAETIRHSGIPCKVTENLEQAHWEKLVWNIPFNGLGVAAAAGYEAMLGHKFDPKTPHPCLTTESLLADPRWEQLIRELMLETIAAACGLGFNLSPALAEKQIARTREMGHYKASTLIDFERGQPLELDSLFTEPLRQAKKAGVATPRLAALCGVLAQLDPGRWQ